MITTKAGSLSCLIFFLFSLSVSAQKHDYVWLAGYHSWAGIIDTNSEFGITKLDFNSNPVEITYDSLGMNFDDAICSISDKDGNLLFYSNGNYIANKWDEKIPNSDSLSFGYVSYVWDPSIAIDGQRIPRTITAIPAPVNTSVYYIFNILIDTFNILTNLTGKALYHTVLNPYDGGGYITEKKSVLVDDLPSGEMTFTKHANGRDWWLIGQLRKTSCFYRFLVTRDGIIRLSNQCVSNNVYETNDGGGGGFSRVAETRCAGRAYARRRLRRHVFVRVQNRPIDVQRDELYAHRAQTTRAMPAKSGTISVCAPWRTQ